MAWPSLFRTISPARAKISPGTILTLLANGIVNTDELCVIRKCCFHLHFMNHFWNALHHLIAPQDLTAFRHEFCNRPAVAGSFEHKVRDERYTLGVVELDASRQPGTRNLRGDGNHQLVFFAWRKIHNSPKQKPELNTTTFSAHRT